MRGNHGHGSNGGLWYRATLGRPRATDLPMRILVTGGAGYIGSLLTARHLADGHEVVVVDRLLFGGDALLPLRANQRFSLHRRNVAEQDLDDLMRGIDIVYHLAAVVGYPACRELGAETSRLYNVEATRRVFESADRARVPRFVFASTYSNYGLANGGDPVTEDSPLYPQSLYAETKIEAERYLLARAPESSCAPIIPRFTTLFGVSPRTRFDLLVNQFVLEALTEHRLMIYQGGYRRSFVHVGDVVRALVLFAEAPVELVRGQIFNVGSDEQNHTKGEVAQIVREAIPEVSIENCELSFDGDMRDVAVSCRKIADILGFRTSVSVADGVREVRDALLEGLIYEPTSPRHRSVPSRLD